MFLLTDCGFAHHIRGYFMQNTRNKGYILTMRTPSERAKSIVLTSRNLKKWEREALSVPDNVSFYTDYAPRANTADPDVLAGLFARGFTRDAKPFAYLTRYGYKIRRHLFLSESAKTRAADVRAFKDAIKDLTLSEQAALWQERTARKAEDARLRANHEKMRERRINTHFKALARQR
jgi:hypothetical protein